MRAALSIFVPLFYSHGNLQYLKQLNARQYTHLLEGKLALKMSVFGAQQHVSYRGNTQKNSSWKFVEEKNMTFCQEFANANSAPPVNTSMCSATQVPKGF